MLFFAEAASGGAGLSPFLILAIGIVFIVVAIVGLRLHAFVALTLAAFLTGFLIPNLSFEGAIELTAENFGKAAGSIGLVIAFASIIGMCLMESGAADQIVRRAMAFFGEKRAGIAMLVSGFLLSIPVFFDTVFFLLIPIARALSLRTGKNFMLYVMAMAGGGAITHSIVPPTPGPLLVSDALNITLGVTMVGGVIAGILPAVSVWYVAKWLNRRYNIPLRPSLSANTAEMDKMASKSDSELPGFWLSIMPVLLPAVLVAAASFFIMAQEKLPGFVEFLGGTIIYSQILDWVRFLGNKNFALMIGAGLAMWIYLRQGKLSFAEMEKKLGPPLESAGVIILITAAGGAFGAMIRQAGVGEAIRSAAEGYSVNYVLLAWVVTAVIRVAQGSATVAMITASALMASVLEGGATLPYHTVYIYFAIGFGSMILSWMNDSGFWVVGKLSGFTEKETLKTWTVVVTVISIVGLIQTLVLSAVLPLK